jgi:hypothetical protein
VAGGAALAILLELQLLLVELMPLQLLLLLLLLLAKILLGLQLLPVRLLLLLGMLLLAVSATGGRNSPGLREDFHFATPASLLCFAVSLSVLWLGHCCPVHVCAEVLYTS